jgi:hypothetical protein
MLLLRRRLPRVEREPACGLISPDEFDRDIDCGNYIGFTNGVYDVFHDRFMPKGSVPFNVLVSMTARYAYAGPEDPLFPEMRCSGRSMNHGLVAHLVIQNPDSHFESRRRGAVPRSASQVFIPGHSRRHFLLFRGGGGST